MAPAPGETVVTKTKPGAFSTTGLDIMLREMGVDTVILMGVATSGCVLSTIRWAVDINYKPFVVVDACSDPDPEVHRVLTEKVYPRNAIAEDAGFKPAMQTILHNAQYPSHITLPIVLR